MQITYKDKVTLQSNPNIPDENKVTAKDMNEIKSVINFNEEEQQALNMSVQEIAQNVVNNSQEISNIKEEQTTQNDNIQTNSNNISDLQSNKADKNEIPTDLSQLSNENTKFVNETGLENAISQEKTQRQNADNNLQNQIDAITASTDVIDIVGTYQDLQDYDTSKVKQNDVIKVLKDSTHNNAMSYYRWQNQWIYIGIEGPYYTIGQTDELLQGKANQSDLKQTNTNVTNLAGRVSNNERKIENIEQEQTEQNTNISTNATNIESLQEENENLKKIVSQLPQVEGQGTEVTLENTIEAQFTIFDEEGNSVQDGTPNPNYEQPIESAGDNENIWNGEIERGAINGDGLDVDATNRVRNVGYYELNKGTYTLSYKGAEQSVVYIFNANKVKVNNPSWENGKSTFTLEENGYIKYALKQLDNREMNVNDVSEIKLEKGNKASGYSPYGMGSINEKISNKNLLKISNGTRTSNGLTGTYNDGILEYNGTASATSSTLTNTTNNILSAGTYTFSIDKPINVPIRLRLTLEDNTTQDITINSGSTSVTFTLTQNATSNYIFIYNLTNGTAYNNTISIQLEPGSTATPYVEHEEQDYSIFVQQPFRSNKDKTIKDKFVIKSDNKKYERHWIGEVVLNGTEYWELLNSTSDYYEFITYNSLKPVAPSSYTFPMASHFGNATNNRCVANGNQLLIRVPASMNITNATEFKTWLQENNVTINYLLVEPLDLPCTEEQIQQLENKPSTYKDFTIIQSQDETPAYLEVSGIYDLNKLISRVEVIESEV